MRFFWDIVRAPVPAARKKHGRREPLLQVLQAALLMAAAFSVSVSAAAFPDLRSIALAGALSFAVMILFTLVLAGLFFSMLRVSGKMTFPQALLMTAESVSVLAGGMLLAALLLYLPAAGILLAALALLPFAALSFAVLYGHMRSLGIEAALALGALFFSVVSIAVVIFAVRLLLAFGALGAQLFA